MNGAWYSRRERFMRVIRTSLPLLIAAILLLPGIVSHTLSASAGSKLELQTARPSQSDLSSGKALFDESCSSCHGQDAAGGIAPNIQRAPATLGDEGVTKIIKNGLPGTGMPAFSSLSDEQTTQIVSLSVSLARGRHITRISEDNQVVSSGKSQRKGKAVYLRKWRVPELPHDRWRGRRTWP